MVTPATALSLSFSLVGYYVASAIAHDHFSAMVHSGGLSPRSGNRFQFHLAPFAKVQKMGVFSGGKVTEVMAPQYFIEVICAMVVCGIIVICAAIVCGVPQWCCKKEKENG